MHPSGVARKPTDQADRPQLRRDEIAFELDAPGVHPESAPTVQVLRAAAAYFALLDRDAALAEHPLDLRGLQVRDKCVMFTGRVASPEAARAAIERTNHYLTLETTPPPGLKQLRDRAREAIDAMGAEFRFKSHVGKGWSLPVKVTAEGTSRPLDGTISLRARLLRVGGRKPVARFESDAEPGRPFSLRTDPNTARELGKHLYREVDVVARVQRSTIGEIVDGDLLEHEIVDEDSQGEAGFEAWRTWFREHASAWNEVEDVEGELRRG